MIIRKTFRFEASHILPNHKGKCSRLHGHSWVLHVFVEGPRSGPNSFVQDYAEVSEAVKPLIEKLDHRHLGQYNRRIDVGLPSEHLFVESLYECECVPGLALDFYPSSENLLWWIAKELHPVLPQWCKFELEETCTSNCELSRKEYDEASHR